MGLRWDRTEYDEHRARIFHIVPNNSTIYSDLVKKFGSENVFQGSSHAVFNTVLGHCKSLRGDLIVVHPGTYTWAGTADTAPVSVAKSHVTIRGANENAPSEVSIVCTADNTAFSVAAGGDGVTIENIAITIDDAASNPEDGIIVASGAIGVRIRNCIFVGADKATVAIDSEGDRLVIEGCRFEDVKTSIQSNGNYSIVRSNYINTDNTGAVGIELTAGNWCEIHENHIDASGGTGDTGIKLANGCLLGRCTGNTIHASCNDPINPGSSTMAITGNRKTGSKTTDFTITNATTMEQFIYT